MKTMQLRHLNEGDNFDIPSLNGLMRNLVVLRLSPCSVLVKGEKRDTLQDEWKTFRQPLSPSTNVIYKSHKQVRVTYSHSSIDSNLENDKNTSLTRRKRGRPKKSVDIKLPIGEWTVAEVAKLNGCQNYDIANYIKKNLNRNIKIVGSRKGFGMGRPSALYRFF